MQNPQFGFGFSDALACLLELKVWDFPLYLPLNVCVDFISLRLRPYELAIKQSILALSLPTGRIH
ncbi:unnamed protein product [Arabidopsis thaliana]|uniref:(thale cress) hypothetical protein n=1 Tax=Arabidopsis thaliana TaxID=3702 RepID=A0A7G2EYI5_ARATH|nr:unnamed protein product [Arabidopsis thaliana]